MTRLARIGRLLWTARPILLDAAAFAAITIGVWLLAGEWAWIVAGVLLVLAGRRAQS